MGDRDTSNRNIFIEDFDACSVVKVVRNHDELKEMSDSGEGVNKLDKLLDLEQLCRDGEGFMLCLEDKTTDAINFFKVKKIQILKKINLY